EVLLHRVPVAACKKFPTERMPGKLRTPNQLINDKNQQTHSRDRADKHCETKKAVRHFTTGRGHQWQRPRLGFHRSFLRNRLTRELRSRKCLVRHLALKLSGTCYRIVKKGRILPSWDHYSWLHPMAPALEHKGCKAGAEQWSIKVAKQAPNNGPTPTLPT